jgi:hypothetical protein
MQDGDMKDLIVKFIPLSEMRYANLKSSTCIGDYWTTETEIHFRVVAFPDKPFYSLAILIHELYEKFKNNQLGITDEEVDKFDNDHPGLEDAGASLDAPYHKQHMGGDLLERAVITLSGEDWTEYEEAVDSLFLP